MSTLKGKVAIVTGGSKGIGAAIARELAAAGAAVAVNYSSSREGADRTVAAIVGAGGKAIAVQGDMTKTADVKRLFEVTKKELGVPSVLVNNAGVYQFGPIEAVTEADFRRHFDINVLGPILATQEALKYFPASGGSIVNISTITSTNPLPNTSIYSASKAAVDSLTLGLARELGPRKIRVNAVAPGGTATEGTVSGGIVGSELEKTMVAATPLGRFGRAEDIAPIVVFLASDEASWITGERITASGGLR